MFQGLAPSKKANDYARKRFEVFIISILPHERSADVSDAALLSIVLWKKAGQEAKFCVKQQITSSQTRILTALVFVFLQPSCVEPSYS
jgi:hypothetical protein